MEANGVPGAPSDILNGMRPQALIALSGLLSIVVLAHPQSPQLSFEVASVRASQHEGGPDYNNQITYSATEFTGRNLTLRRLVAEAWHCQRNQVIGPPWLDHDEYDIAARLPDGATSEQIPLMLRTLLADRFHLKAHSEIRPMRVYDLTVAQNGPRIHPIEPGKAKAAAPGLHFRGDMHQFADLLAVQISIPAPTSADVPVIAGGPMIPVLDKTGLQGIYEFSVDLRPEIGTDGFTFWKRVLEDQLGLKIEAGKADVAFVIVDDAVKIPTAN
jgi:uncharacterized protein (TIGR03435 family)